VELDLRHVRDDAELGGLGRSNDGDLVFAHRLNPSQGGTRPG
jgi:hypothetical protein